MPQLKEDGEPVVVSYTSADDREAQRELHGRATLPNTDGALSSDSNGNLKPMRPGSCRQNAPYDDLLPGLKTPPRSGDAFLNPHGLFR